jgi:CRISPR/Cas system-associated exonuclease Cas4 (RecB family)
MFHTSVSVSMVRPMVLCCRKAWYTEIQTPYIRETLLAIAAPHNHHDVTNQVCRVITSGVRLPPSSRLD